MVEEDDRRCKGDDTILQSSSSRNLVRAEEKIRVRDPRSSQSIYRVYEKLHMLYL